MKPVKVIIYAVLVISVVIGVLMASNIDFAKLKKQMNTTDMYVVVTENGKAETIQFDDKDSMTRFHYVQEAYDKNGAAKKITFSANKNLRLNAILLVTVQELKDADGHYLIGSYEEVQADLVPEKTKIKLGL
ncbi:YxeA family protein [Paenibacillus sp. 1001270B_150601_E10]|uniref:YxeA family protein n=1 Tax=Paenibacillus sp. 1001270B_150601_E10 TaxID=2787079 RepID=UPI0018A0631D|nr:YxeA family protein [Paenibacillus sp. 1001270B_150601_E10]